MPTVRISGGSRLTMSAARPTARNRFDDGTKLNPTASAPIATASSASSSLVIPQILTNTREGYRAPPLRRATVAALLSSAGCGAEGRSEEHTSELQSLMRISYAVFCLKKKKQ